jgi:hypothetical protein
MCLLDVARRDRDTPANKLPSSFRGSVALLRTATWSVRYFASHWCYDPEDLGWKWGWIIARVWRTHLFCSAPSGRTLQALHEVVPQWYRRSHVWFCMAYTISDWLVERGHKPLELAR